MRGEKLLETQKMYTTKVSQKLNSIWGYWLLKIILLTLVISRTFSYILKWFYYLISMFTYTWDSFLLLSSQECPKKKIAQFDPDPLSVLLTC